MKCIKNINNNICLCLDSKGREIIAFGKGIGFIKPPYDIPLSKINRTFYNIKDADFEAMKNIPVEVINIAINIIDKASIYLNAKYPSSAIFAMADHINYALKRANENIYLDMPIVQDLKLLYPKEMELAVNTIDYINKELNANLQRNEIGMIALHLINDREVVVKEQQNTEEIIEKCTHIIEEKVNIKIDKNSFNYSRFVTHFDYMLKRIKESKQATMLDKDVFKMLIEKYPENYKAAKCIQEILFENENLRLNDGEMFYLLIHINRLCEREKQNS